MSTKEGVVRDTLVVAGVKNLREFGYPDCNKDNILTDMIYRRFFLSILMVNRGYSMEADKAIDELISVCEVHDKKVIRKVSKKVKG